MILLKMLVKLFRISKLFVASLFLACENVRAVVIIELMFRQEIFVFELSATISACLFYKGVAHIACLTGAKFTTYTQTINLDFIIYNLGEFLHMLRSHKVKLRGLILVYHLFRR